MYRQKLDKIAQTDQRELCKLVSPVMVPATDKRRRGVGLLQVGIKKPIDLSTVF